jgi:hypothetical protein
MMPARFLSYIGTLHNIHQQSSAKSYSTMNIILHTGRLQMLIKFHLTSKESRA